MHNFTFKKLVKRLSWHHIYYGLAIIDILTIVAALTLTQVLMTTYEDSVESNKRMSKNISEFIELGVLAQAVNEPGNRVFETRDVKIENLALEKTLNKFNIALSNAQKNLKLSFNERQVVNINKKLTSTDLAMQNMVGESRLIFQAINNNMDKKAGEHMSLMDAQFYNVTTSLGNVTQYISDIQNAHFEQQVKRAKEIKQIEIIISLFVLVIVISVTIFGHKLGKTLKGKEQQIRNSLEKAYHSAQAKEQFLANMSHEIRTPLNATLSLMKLIDNKALSEKDQEYLKLSMQSSTNLLAIINDILNLSKIESGNIELEHLDFNVKQLLEDQIAIFRESYAEQNVPIKAELDLLTITGLRGDRGKLTQVLTNILNNAFKFTSRGSITLNAETDIINDKVQLSIEVIDSGIGISAQQIERIFDPFSQADSSTTRQFGGTGLGLSISRKICRIMGGDLTVTSKEGIGSNFKIEVLLDKGELKTPSSETQSASDNKLDFKNLNLHVLVAEDNMVNQVVIKALLTKMNCTFDIAENGQQALELLNEKHNLVIMDCQMPIKDGYQATKEIRSLNSEQRDIPIIALTANSLEGDKEKCLQAGMNDYLSKPIQIDELYQILSTI